MEAGVEEAEERAQAVRAEERGGGLRLQLKKVNLDND